LFFGGAEYEPGTVLVVVVDGKGATMLLLVVGKDDSGVDDGGQLEVEVGAL
jgi:hypothetical protein